MNKFKYMAVLAALLACANAYDAQAQISPSISGEVVLELQNEYTLNSDDPATDEYNNMFFRSEVAPTI